MRGFRIPLRLVLLVNIVGVVSVFAAGCSREPDVPIAPSDSDAVVRLALALDAIVPDDAVIEKLAGDFQFIEGPVWIEDATRGPHLLFSDIRANTIYSWSPTEGVSEFLNPVTPDDSEAGGNGGSNGLSLDLEERLILCEHGNRQVSRIETDNSRSVLADRYEGKRLNRYDVLEDGRLSEGTIFFDATESDAPGVPDGLRVDTSGNVYATGPGGVDHRSRWNAPGNHPPPPSCLRMLAGEMRTARLSTSQLARVFIESGSLSPVSSRDSRGAARTDMGAGNRSKPRDKRRRPV